MYKWIIKTAIWVEMQSFFIHYTKNYITLKFLNPDFNCILRFIK